MDEGQASANSCIKLVLSRKDLEIYIAETRINMIKDLILDAYMAMRKLGGWTRF